MKFIILCLLSGISLLLKAQYVVSEKQSHSMDKFLKRNFILDFPSNFETEKDFWLFMQRSNRDYQKFYGKGQSRDLDIDLKNKSVSYTNTLKNSNEVGLTSEFDSLYISLKKILLGDDYQEIENLHIIYNNTYNAYALADSSIWIHSSIIKDFSADEIAFVLAHEFSHVVLKQMSIAILKEKKRDVRNQILGGLMVAAVGTSQAIASSSPYSDHNSYSETLTSTVSSLEDAIEVDNTLYHFKYSQDQEFVADITAFYYMKFFGFDTRAAISALEKLNTANNTTESDLLSTHPSILDRILLLKHLETVL